MVQRVVEQARLSSSLLRVVVATDDRRVLEHVEAFGGEAVMTSPDHVSGTDRCHEASELLSSAGHDAVINIQGDEPFIVPAQIDELCNVLRDATGGIATLAQVVTDDKELDGGSEVFITTDVRMNALYFSRSPIPCLRDAPEGPRHARFRFLKHVGLYGYRKDVLAGLVALPPSSLEQAEKLEQLRWLEHGHDVRVGLTSHPSFCVDTPEDLEEARRRVQGTLRLG